MKTLTFLAIFVLSASMALASGLHETEVSMNVLEQINVRKDKAEAFDLIRESGALAYNPEAWAICVSEDTMLFAGLPNLPVCEKANTVGTVNGEIGGVPFSAIINAE